MTKKIAILLVVLSVLSLSFATITAQDTNTLVVASFYPIDQVSGWDGVVSVFQERHPDVEVEVQVTTFDEYLPRLLSQIAGGDPPDVIGVENNPFPQFVSRGILEDLTPYLEESESLTRDSFFPHLIDRYTVDDRVYGIPYDAQPIANIFYNPALFDEAGVEYPNENWTWDDAREAAIALTKFDADGNVEQYGWTLCSPNDDWRYILYSGGGALVDDVRNPIESRLDDPASIEAIQFYIDLMYTDRVTPEYDLIQSLGGNQVCNTFLMTGNTAMITAGFWKAVESPQGMADLGIQMALAPVKDLNNRVYPTGGTAYTILESSDNKELAWEFIELWMGQPGYEAAYEEATLGAIYPPAHMPSYDWYTNQPIEFVNTIEPNREALEYIIFGPFSLEWPEIEARCVVPELDLVLRGDIPVEEGLTRAAECVNASL